MKFAKAIISSIVISSVLSQVCLGTDLTSYAEKKREEIIKNKIKKEHMLSNAEVKQIATQLSEMSYREKLNNINKQKEIIANSIVNVNMNGYVGNYIISDLVYKDGDTTPFGRINLRDRKIGNYYIVSGNFIGKESFMVQNNTSSISMPILSSPSMDTVSGPAPASLPPPPPLPSR